MIGFVVEDRALEALVLALTEKMGFSTSRNLIRYMNGNRLRKAKKHASDLLSRGCEKVVILKDLEGAPPQIEERFKQIDFPSQSELIIVVREAETWFLADEEALRDLGIKVKAIPEPERIPDPKGFLNRLFRRYKGRDYYESGRDPFEIARRLNLEKLRKCPSFSSFEKAVRGE